MRFVVYVTEGELLTECNSHIDAYIKCTINYVLIICNKYKSITNRSNNFKRAGYAFNKLGKSIVLSLSLSTLFHINPTITRDWVWGVMLYGDSSSHHQPGSTIFMCDSRAADSYASAFLKYILDLPTPTITNEIQFEKVQYMFDLHSY